MLYQSSRGFWMRMLPSKNLTITSPQRRVRDGLKSNKMIYKGSEGRCAFWRRGIVIGLMIRLIVNSWKCCRIGLGSRRMNVLKLIWLILTISYVWWLGEVDSTHLTISSTAQREIVSHFLKQFCPKQAKRKVNSVKRNYHQKVASKKPKTPQIPYLVSTSRVPSHSTIVDWS